jgi:hypothetical protein
MNPMKKLLTAFVALSLASCNTTFGDGSLDPSAPVEQAQTEASKALVVAWRAFDALIAAGEGLRDAGVLRPGTETAIRVADAVQAARLALTAATSAARAGDIAQFRTALSQAQDAFRAAEAAIRSR